ncbi:ADP-ribosyl cyclase/cyclic ADP-ribose hydrolase-like isoform X1 [Mytilus trossulus]|uniref:ADP-ribosyl cyclase/cyclic ADP-ribose hydrolase-like isoform X1 n=2 Tax=Mytilus trossulus TaxID=6551 RepID=UPI003006CE86
MDNYFTITLICSFGCVLSNGCNNMHRNYTEWETLFIGKCLAYKSDYGTISFCKRNIDCDDLWQKFIRGVEYQSKCDFNQGSYEEFLRASEHAVPANKFMFWSGVYSLVMRYSNKGQRYFTIADTLTGYLLDNMVWCGNATESDGIEKDLETCPGFHTSSQCSQTATTVFWSAASQNFARLAEGNIHVMINASRTPAFRPDSYFTTKELPNINATKVKKATILMVHYLRDPLLETCFSDSIIDLGSRFQANGIVAECVDNPRAVHLLMCADDPEQSGCQHLLSTSTAVNLTYMKSHYYVLVLICIIVMLY